MVDVHIKITLNPVTFHRDNYKVLFKKNNYKGLPGYAVPHGHYRTHTHTHTW